jgi:hypothetical protein
MDMDNLFEILPIEVAGATGFTSFLREKSFNAGIITTLTNQ